MSDFFVYGFFFSKGFQVHQGKKSFSKNQAKKAVSLLNALLAKFSDSTFLGGRYGDSNRIPIFLKILLFNFTSLESLAFKLSSAHLFFPILLL